jgi:Carboxypeptidase regulatory-like domain
MRMRPNSFPRKRFATVIALCAVFAAAASAATITGTVTNGTTKTPAAGDTVTLIALDQSMREIAHTTTDAQGHFSIDAPDPGMHLIRIDHQGAGYFQPAPPNTPNVNAQVFDVAATVAGVSTVANVMRVETDQQGLRVTQSFFIKNDSNPPRTQFGKRSYDFYLPPDAVIEGSAAMAPGGMPVQSSPVPLGEKGHYAFLFPLRPGVTQFQLSYHLPYSGSLAFDQHFAGPTDSFVVMMPKSMSFKAGEGVSFQPLNETPGALTFLARGGTPAHPFAFTVSGSGAMPRDTQAESQSNDNAQGGSAAANDTRPGGGLGVPIDTPDPLNKYKWWILGGITLVFAVGAGFLLRRQGDAPATEVAAVVPALPNLSGGGLLAALKDELFALETDRLQGRLTDSEYEQHKQALELVLRRALAKKPA